MSELLPLPETGRMPLREFGGSIVQRAWEVEPKAMSEFGLRDGLVGSDASRRRH
jgi:hypothetical protein